MIQLLRKALLSLLAVGCIAICVSGCKSGEVQNPAPTNDVQQSEAGADTTPLSDAEKDRESSHPGAQEEKTEEETIKSVYRDGAEETLCIFTSSGNNGTGFVYEEKYVITNAHVLYDSDEFTLKDVKGREYDGTVVFSADNTDIAIIQIDDYHGKSVTLGDSDAVSVGEQVVLIGNPADGDPFTLRTGKRVELEEDLQPISYNGISYIALDADIESGFSGGPVFNLRGELIGISHAKYTGDLSAYGLNSLSFIIPINSVKGQIEENCASIEASS